MWQHVLYVLTLVACAEHVNLWLDPRLHLGQQVHAATVIGNISTIKLHSITVSKWSTRGHKDVDAIRDLFPFLQYGLSSMGGERSELFRNGMPACT